MTIWENIDIWKLLGGLGIFLFAMFTLENSIKKLAGRSFKKFIRTYTNGRLKSIFAGTIVTSILQSSSAVSLMVLAFVGAGIMAMKNAIGVIIGSNIGTTTTAWIVASFGFKMDIESFALPIIGIGGLVLIFLGKSDKYSNVSKLFVSFGFLFLGLSYMKESVDSLTTNISIEDIPDYGLLFFILIGTLLTAAMQSSSATIAIVLTGVNAGLISFDGAACMVIGANIGTTATVLIGGIRATQIKKRVAFSHLFFNISTAIIGFALLYPITYCIKQIIGPIDENAVVGIALFHTIFNIIGVILFFPFVGVFSNWLIKIIPDKEVSLAKHIHHLTPTVFDAAIAGIKSETIQLLKNSMSHNLSIVKARKVNKTLSPLIISKISSEKQYDNLKLLQSEIFKFSSEVQATEIDETDGAEIVKLLYSARLALNSSKTLKDIEHNLLDFESQDNDYLNNIDNNLKEQMKDLYTELLLVLEDRNVPEIAGHFSQMLQQIEKDDKDFVMQAMEAARKEVIHDKNTSEVLLVNRAYIHSSKQMINCLMELMLDRKELAIFEELTEKKTLD